MLEVFVNLFGSFLLSSAGFYIIKKITRSTEKITSLKNGTLVLLLAIITVVLHKNQYTGIESLIIFMANIIIYKNIFRLSLEESTISVGIMMIAIIIGDLITAIFLTYFYSFPQIRSKALLTLLADISVCLIDIIIINVKIIDNQILKFYKYCKKRQSIINGIFFIVLIIGLCTCAYNITLSKSFNLKYIMNAVLIISLCITAYIFIKNRNNYNELNDEYDSLFTYVQNFEEWIEKEQLNRHEYKNQLAVLYCLTNEKEVKDKINDILEDNINVDGDVINQLKQLPKGGIKGLIYYKVAIAQKQKVKVTANISLENKSNLNKLNEKEIRIICKLIGIYLDNAIEASAETSKKTLSIEVYELPNRTCFVFSNSFKKKANFDERNKKGVTTKGEGHGNGLYFAAKLIESNDWLESTQEIVDKYYIQKLVINKKESKN